MFEPFLLRAIAGGVGVAMIAAPLGCFVVWRRMAYFGDTLSHAGLLGIALAILAGLDPMIGMIFICSAIGLLLFLLQLQRRVPTDTLLGVLSHSALAIGLITVSFVRSVRVDLNALLFGDILAISLSDLALIYLGGIGIIGTLALVWRGLIAATVNEDIAGVEGQGGNGERLLFIALLALTIAIAMKVVGILLITALLIIPAAAARRLARSPEAMVLFAAAIGCLAAVGGILASYVWDTPSGASIVATASVFFAISLLASLRTGLS
jgi:zinc transport system permease protein